MSLPFPGTKVRGSTTGKPIMALLDLLGRTWGLGIIWNLHQGPATFRQLQRRCEHISPTLLNSRLKEFKELNLIELCDEGYQLSTLGDELFGMIKPMEIWSKKWSQSLSGEREYKIENKVEMKSKELLKQDRNV